MNTPSERQAGEIPSVRCPVQRLRGLFSFGSPLVLPELTSVEWFLFFVGALQICLIRQTFMAMVSHDISVKVGRVLDHVGMGRLGIGSEQVVRRFFFQRSLAGFSPHWRAVPAAGSETEGSASENGISKEVAEELMEGLAETVRRLEFVWVPEPVVRGALARVCDHLRILWRECRDANPKVARDSDRAARLHGLSLGQNLQIVGIASLQTFALCLGAYGEYRAGSLADPAQTPVPERDRNDLSEVAACAHRIGMWLMRYPAEVSHALQNILSPSHLSFQRNEAGVLRITVDREAVAEDVISALDELGGVSFSDGSEFSSGAARLRAALAPFSEVLGKRVDLRGCPAGFTAWPRSPKSLADTVSRDMIDAYAQAFAPYLERAAFRQHRPDLSAGQ